MTDSPSKTLGALCDVPFSPLNWDKYGDIQSALAINETSQLHLLSLPMIGQEFVASHREWTSVKEAVPVAELLSHLGVSSYEIVSDKGVRTLQELRIRKTLYVMSIDSRGDICIDALDDKSKDFGVEISRISFGNGDKPYVLLSGEKPPAKTSPAVMWIIGLVRKATGATFICPL